VIQHLHRRPLLTAQEMPVGVHRERRRSMPETPGDSEDVDASAEPETRRRVSQRVPVDRLGLHDVRAVEHPPISVVERVPVPRLPAGCRKTSPHSAQLPPSRSRAAFWRTRC